MSEVSWRCKYSISERRQEGGWARSVFDIPPTKAVGRVGSGVEMVSTYPLLERAGGWVVTVSRRQAHQGQKGLLSQAPLVVELESR